MVKLENPEDLAKEALRYLEIAQKLEEEKDMEKSISYYQKAADFLKRSGFLMHRLSDIYERIDYLNKYIKQDQVLQRAQVQSEIAKLQDEAFILLEGAKKLEFEGFFDDAIEQYKSSITLLIQSGWTEAQLENLQTKVKILRDKIEKQKLVKEGIHEKESIELKEDAPQVVGFFGEKSSIDKAESIEQFKAMKNHEEDLQDQAFAHIDKAKMFEKEKRFDTAIMNYERAIELLNSIGWQAQTKNIHTIIQKLAQEKEEFEAFQLRQSELIEDNSDRIQEQRDILESDSMIKHEKLKDFEDKKKMEDIVQNRAFKLIDTGNRLEREKNYGKALDHFNQAIELLTSIEWDSYIQPILKLIDDIKVKQKREKKAEKLKEKRQKNLAILQDSIYMKQREQIFQSTKDLEVKKERYKNKRKGENRKEKELFSILENADQTLKDKNYDGAIEEYKESLTILEDLGPEWATYTTTINNMIANVEKIKKDQISIQYESQTKLEKRKQEEIEVQKQIDSYLRKERDRLKKKEITLKEYAEKIGYFEQRKIEAFKLLDSASSNLKQGAYEEAITAYQNAGNIFAEIQWTDEIPIIEKSIKEVEALQEKHHMLLQKKLQETLAKQREEEEFQKEIAYHLQQEKDKLKRKEIELKEHEQELKYREEQRKIGFKLIAEAQDDVKRKEFDKAVETLQYAINFFSDVDWQNEVNLIQDSIIEIENKKREAEVQEQIKLQAEIEREKQEREFQEYIRNEMIAQREDLKQEELTIREKSKELAFREKRKEDAFKLLDKAQEFLSQNKFDTALELYHDVSTIFAQIQWTEEIPVIYEATNEIKNKKREFELYKQEILENAVKKESRDRAFLERIQYYRERERNEILNEQDQIENRRQISSQNLVKEQNAIKMIEDGDNLIKINKFNEAIEEHLKAIEILEEIGWGEGNLLLLQETVNSIKVKKEESEKEKLLEYEVGYRKQKEDEQFQQKIKKFIDKEKTRLKDKEIRIKEREELTQQMEKHRLEAFNLLDKGEVLLNQGKYDDSLENYRQAEIILNEINFPTGIIREMNHKIQEKKREEDLNKFKELEVRFRNEQNEELFQQQILERIQLEEQILRDRQEKLRQLEEEKRHTEKRKTEAFKILEEAQNSIESERYDEAIEHYKKSAIIFKEIHWDQEVELIKDSIQVVENKKRELELRKQIDLKSALEEEKQEKLFQEEIQKDMKIQREKLAKQEILLREQEQELFYREKRKEEAFILLDRAREFLTQNKVDEALEIYIKVSNIFAQIQWLDEIPIIQDAIRKIEEKKRENFLIKQKSIQDAIQQEKENSIFLEQIRRGREKEKAKAIEERSLLEKQEIMNSQYISEEQNAFRFIEEGYNLINKKMYDEALEKYRNGSKLLAEIGWTSGSLILIQNTIKTIELRKKELESKNELENKRRIQQHREEEEFQKRISDHMIREQNRLKTKEIEINKLEELVELKEKRKVQAFEIMDEAGKFFNLKQFNQAIEKYRNAELILNEIGFPTQAVREIISKIQVKSREELIAKQIELERRLHKEQENLEFQQQIKHNIKINEMKLRVRQVELDKQRDYRNYMERRKEEAFNLLEEGEVFMKQTQYDKTLDYYHAAELILNEISFPTGAIREMIFKVQEKRRVTHLQKQMGLEKSLEREKQEQLNLQKISTGLEIEKNRLAKRQFETQKLDELKLKLEERKIQAFTILDEAEHHLKLSDYDSALNNYRKAEIVLNELQFPTDSIRNMIRNINNLKKQEEKSQLLEYQRKLDNLQEEKALNALIEERKRQEKGKKRAQQLALQERDKVIQEQKSARESAYSLLEEAGKYLKRHNPDYNNAISLYIQARNILAENVGWEPEINNLSILIKDLQEEQVSFADKKRLEELARFERQKEYEMFQEEIKKRRIEQEKVRREQERQFRKVVLKKQQIGQIKDEGLRLIDEGKNFAVYHDFPRAYKNLNMAISKFREIGWENEIKYIETEIKNAKDLEQRVEKEAERAEQIQKQLEEQRILEEKRRKIEFDKLKETKEEVSDLADTVMSMILEKKEEQKIAEKEKIELIKKESKEFRREMGKLIKFKEELHDELAKKEKEKKLEADKLKEAKEREEIDGLKNMINDAAKDKKK